MALSNYYDDIDIIKKESTSDDLGGFIVQYVKLGTIKGLLQRSSTSERTIAAQLGVSAVYTLMTGKTNALVSEIKPDVIVKSKSITAIVTSNELDGQGDLSNVAQWQAESYSIPLGTVIL
jgi:hypothetical protein